MTDRRTSKYQVSLSIKISEQNAYGDEIGSGNLSWSGNTSITTLSGLGALLERLSDALNERPTIGGISNGNL